MSTLGAKNIMSFHKFVDRFIKRKTNVIDNKNSEEEKNNGVLSQEEQDEMLAMALAQSEIEDRGGGSTILQLLQTTPIASMTKHVKYYMIISLHHVNSIFGENCV